MKITTQGLFSAILTVLTVAGLLVTDPLHVQAQTVLKTVQATLTWTANTEADLAGYKVYRGQGATACAATATLAALVDGAGAPVKVTPSASPTFVDNTFQSVDSTICYEVTAYDTAGNESPRSNRAVASVNVNPPSAPQSLNLSVVIK